MRRSTFGNLKDLKLNKLEAKLIRRVGNLPAWAYLIFHDKMLKSLNNNKGQISPNAPEILLVCTCY